MTTKVTFKLPSEFVANASDGVVVGEFNNWNPAEGVQLQKKEDGSMYAEVALVAGKTYQYRYLLNDGRWVNDNTSTTLSDVFGQPVENCVVEVPVVAAEPAIKSTAKEEIAPKTVTAAPKEAAPKKTVTKKETAPKKVTAAPKEAAVKKIAAPKKK